MSITHTRTQLSRKSDKIAGPVAGPPFAVETGRPHPLGAVPDQSGVNFAVFSEHATSVELLLFGNHDDAEPHQVVKLDPRFNKSFQIWHVYVRGIEPGWHYAYRVDGPQQRHDGHRFNPRKVLLDPYAKGTTSTLWDRAAACGDGDNLSSSMRAAIVETAGTHNRRAGDPEAYDWEGDRRLNRPLRKTVIYEMHVGGFTKSPTSATQRPGTFAGVVEKIPYLKELGVTAVELLPVFDFDPTEIDRPNPNGGPRLRNYWGYSTVSFFAPHSEYCTSPTEASHISDFRDMVKALHKAGIEVILDVVFNHTSEGNEKGPMINFSGLDNSVYYYTWPQDRQYYVDYSGCGNTVNCNHPITEKLIVECLEYWVDEMHVDGFRFDEGSILSRGPDGSPMQYPPVLWHIELSEKLADIKLIAEAWDAAGLYQIGYFPGFRWAEWNGRFRDDIRRFVRGDPGLAGSVASRIAGSADIYEATGHLPLSSINFLTCHDGFTLNDLVSYNQKHNEANGEENRDGVNENLSWNCGVEGPTDDPAVERLRSRQVRNLSTILLLSQGIPMITGGDEIRRTQGGNNNAYCQDNDISWFDWELVERNQDLYRFFKHLIAFRKAHPPLHRVRFYRGDINPRGLKDVEWHGCKLRAPGWNDPNCRVLALTIGDIPGDGQDIHVILNMDDQTLAFELPPLSDRQWYRSIDTALASPEDIMESGADVPISGSEYLVTGRSVVVAISR
jgi:glycogen operon protein